MFLNSCLQFIFAMEGILSQRGIIFDTSITITSDIAVFPYSQVFDKACCNSIMFACIIILFYISD